MKRSIIISVIYMAATVIAQLVFGAFPAEWFAFPVNAAVLIAAILGLWVLYREKPECRLSKWLMSGKTSIILIVGLLICALIYGFAPQIDVVHSWPFIFIMMALLANLLMVIFSRRAKIRFLLNHIGVFLALAGGFFGAPDMQVNKVQVFRDAAADMSLQNFQIETAPDGSVQNYTATVLIKGKATDIRVNHPYHKSLFEDVYLLRYDNSDPEVRYCVLETVRQPWKYVMWLGIVMMMLGCILVFVQGVNKKEESV